MSEVKLPAAIAITASLPELIDALGVSRSTMYTAWLVDPKFPKPIGNKIQVRRWALRQVVDWFNQQGGGQIALADISEAVAMRRARMAQLRKRKVIPQSTAQ